MAIFQETKVKISILVTLTLLFVFIGIIPLAISSWRIIKINKEYLQSNMMESFLPILKEVSDSMKEDIGNYQDAVRQMTPTAVSILKNPKASNDIPSLMKDPRFLKVQILHPDGKGPYAQSIDFQSPVLASMESDAFLRSIKGESYVSRVYYDQKDDVPVVILSEPLSAEDSDKVIGTISTVVNLSPLVEMIKKESQGGKVMYVVDGQGNLMLHPKAEEMAAHKNLAQSAIVREFLRTHGLVPTVGLFQEKQDDNKIDILGAYSPIGDYEWGLIIQIERNTVFQPVRIMTRESEQWGVIFALAAALVGFILARWITHPIQRLAQHALDVGRSQNFDRKIDIKGSNEIQQLADTFNYMTGEIKEYVLQLQAAAQENKELFLSSIRMLSAAIDAKDPYTRGHSERVKDYTLVIAKQMALSKAELERLEIAALLHDVGKIGIEDRILRKPTNLTPEEFEIMKTHPDKGANIMGQVAQLADIIPGMRGHHENFDGSGYPQGLKGDQIHLFARIITIADTFDAMTTDRPYQKAFTLEFALNRIRTMANIKYDPKVVEAFSHACEEGKIALHKPARPRPKQPVA
ncbi:MAG: hypothetical protein C5B54_00195 [Acidobacteria bacterium]|nr:MAG: hypothetical protein C5B54_00195 [Acidobacteriota bacterium]